MNNQRVLFIVRLTQERNRYRITTKINSRVSVESAVAKQFEKKMPRPVCEKRSSVLASPRVIVTIIVYYLGDARKKRRVDNRFVCAEEFRSR